MTQQYPATWANFNVYMNMSAEELTLQVAYWDAISYLAKYSVPAPILGNQDNVAPQNHPGVQATFISNGITLNASAILLVFNPTPVITDLMAAGAIPLIPFIQAYVPPSHVTPPISVDLKDLSKALGVDMPGYTPARKALVAAFQGKVALGTFTPDNKWKLVDSGSPFNRDGVWEYQGI